MLDFEIILRRIQLLVEVIFHLEVCQRVKVQSLKIRLILSAESGHAVLLELRGVYYVASANRIRPDMVAHLVKVQAILVHVRQKLTDRLLSLSVVCKVV